jgi:hypothetical protein
MCLGCELNGLVSCIVYVKSKTISSTKSLNYYVEIVIELGIFSVMKTGYFVYAKVDVRNWDAK